MIHIEITDCEDLLAIGHYKLYLPRIFIGGSIHNDIPLENKNALKEIGVVKHLGNSLTFVTELKYKLNGKEVSGILNLNIGDDIQVNDLKFKIIEFDIPAENRVEDYYNYLENLKERSPEKYKFLQALEKHYIKLTGYYDNELLEK